MESPNLPLNPKTSDPKHSSEKKNSPFSSSTLQFPIQNQVLEETDAREAVSHSIFLSSLLSNTWRQNPSQFPTTTAESLVTRRKIQSDTTPKPDPLFPAMDDPQ
uniref:Uncharacterized protein n=1 Tax=Cucumis sativus TaxID=3659 RepID=A0A0A0K3T9_CUCSA